MRWQTRDWRRGGKGEIPLADLPPHPKILVAFLELALRVRRDFLKCARTHPFAAASDYSITFS